MNGLFLHTGNRLETLVEDLAKVVAEPLPSPFTPEIVMVQSLGMHRWLSLQLAERLGICMRFEFPFPRAFIDGALREEVPDMAPAEAFSVELLTWKIHRLLPALLRQPEFAAVRRYTEDGDPLKFYQLASRLAALFDQYLVYRPAMLMEWERSPAFQTSGEPDLFRPSGDEAWQAILWRELNAERRIHFAAALERIAGQGAGAPGGPCQRVSIFGISSLPPAQMEVFFHLAASRPIHLFLLAPSREYHGDDLTPKQRARRGLGPAADAGNPLLTSLGRLNAHFTEIVLETDERAGHRIVDECERFTEPPADTLLHRLQRDILLARNPAAAPGEDDGERPDPPLPCGDVSLQVHVCHSPMREVEALYDRLLAMLDGPKDGENQESVPGLLPRDILVMAPDIEKYAPFIHAVFGYPEEAALRIPYSVADRHPRSESSAVDTFLRLLELPGTRCTGPQFYALFQSEPFRHRFHFTESDLAQIRAWIDESGIRWGLDGETRRELGLPGFAENSWRHGLDRLLLGYAMAGGNRTLFEGILPHDDVEGTGAELLGRLVSAVEALFTTLRELDRPRPLGEWPEVLRAVIERFFAAGEQAEETEAVRRLRECCGGLAQTALAAGAQQPVAFEVMREYLTARLGEAEQRGRFLTGGVTFCALKPMRSIPARVIWLLGMDDGAFPRKPKPLQFDLMARKWKLGDRSSRDDDRYIFLEALLSARDRLCISTVGRSQVNNEAIPPSVVVSELLDYLEQTAVFEDGGDPRGKRVFEHRLQAFSPRYFEHGSPLFSYSAANAATSLASRQKPAKTPPGSDAPFSGAPLAEPGPDEESRIVSLDQLAGFFSNPAAFFLKQRLGLRLEENDDSLLENEPMAVDALAAYGIRRELFEARLKNEDSPPGPPRDCLAFTARGLIPPGSLGAHHLDRMDRAAGAFHARVAPLLGKPGEPVPVDLQLGGFTFNGTLGPVYDGRLTFFRPAKLKPKDRLRAWIAHLARCSLPRPMETRLAGEDEILEFRVPECPAELLEALLAIYAEGLLRPVPFFPLAGYKYMAAALAPPSSRRTRTPLDVARAEWEGGYAGNAERDHPAYRLCFGHGDPLDAEFERLAAAVFGPLLAHGALLPEGGR